MLEIPTPPPPQIPALWGWAAAGGALLVGAAMLLWGRHLHRALLVLIGAGVGAAAAGPLAARFGINVVVLRVTLAVVLAVVGLLAARAVWALLAGGIAVLATTAMVLASTLWRSGQGVRHGQATATLTAWPAQAARECFDAVSRSGALPLTLAVGFIVGGAVLVVLLLRPRAARILMTSFLAAVLLMGAMLLAAAHVRGSLWQTAWDHPYVPAAGAGALLLLGWVWQFFCDGRERRKEDEKDKKPDAQPATSRRK
jgi:hypothetical protein